MSPWVQTRDGHIVDLDAPDLSEVTIDEVAHALARINRFTGHTRGAVPYSVAQHSVLVSGYCPERWRPHGLMHDAHECVIGDISSPVKQALRGGAMTALDERMSTAFFRRFVVGDDWYTPCVGWTMVKNVDLRMLVTERRDLLGVEAKPWCLEEQPYTDAVRPWSVAIAERAFLETFAAFEKEGRVRR